MKSSSRAIVILIVFILSISVGMGLSEGLLPSIVEVYGIEMPSMSAVLFRKPDEIVEETDGFQRVTFNNVIEADYENWSIYIQEFGCSLVSYEVDGSVFSAIIAKDGKQMRFSYDNSLEKMILHYSKEAPEESFEQIWNSYITPFRTVGTTVSFGRYEQDGNIDNGAEEIQWIVMDTQDGKSLLLSKYGIESYQYDKPFRKGISWGECGLRNWLNDKLIYAAFIQDEIQALIPTSTDMSSDRLFLLSVDEANHYLNATEENHNNVKSRVSAAQYVFNHTSAISSDFLTEEGEYAVSWWLRTPKSSDFILTVKEDGSIGNASLNSWCYVRPAIWIDLNKMPGKRSNSATNQSSEEINQAEANAGITTLFPAEKIDWWEDDINSLWENGANYPVYDLLSGLTWNAYRSNGDYHVEAEPLTAEDTALLCQCYGVTSVKEIQDNNLYQRRPCLVTIEDRTFACSLYGVPHNDKKDIIKTNDFPGQLCIHFTNSWTHGGQKVDSLHAEAIDYAWENAPNGHK